MRWLICLLFLTNWSPAQNAEPLEANLAKTYDAWRTAVINRNVRSWQTHTAPHRQMEIRNRIVSEKEAISCHGFPPSFTASFDPRLEVSQRQAKRANHQIGVFWESGLWIGGQPTDNLLVLSFIRGNGTWLYDKADFVNLTALPEVKKELAAGNLKYLEETADAQPNGVVPKTPLAARPAKYIAKLYVFCPGREVEVRVNKFSHHRFANAQEAEVVIGGARDGANEVQFRVEPLEGGLGTEAFTVRVYLMSEIRGVKPVKVYEYLVQEEGKVKGLVSETFRVDADDIRKLMGQGG